jgi:hypothetical protein
MRYRGMQRPGQVAQDTTDLLSRIVEQAHVPTGAKQPAHPL